MFFYRVNVSSVTKTTAIKYIMKELLLTEEVARKLVARQNIDGDSEIAEEELTKLWNDFLEV